MPNIKSIIADDALAITFQTICQYRAFLLKKIDEASNIKVKEWDWVFDDGGVGFIRYRCFGYIIDHFSKDCFYVLTAKNAPKFSSLNEAKEWCKQDRIERLKELGVEINV